jgi:lipopolysaccharide transport system permease protein
VLRVTAQLLNYRDLLLALTGRELKARYRGSGFGFSWSLINPVLLLAVYTFVFGVIFPQGGRMGASGTDPYWLFLVTGLFPWIWFSSSLLEGVMALSVNAALIRKAVFPIAILPMVAVASNLVHFLLTLPVLGVALIVGRFQGYSVGGWLALLFPIVVLLHVVMISGLAIGLAALNVHFKDVRDLLTNLITLGFFVTPILYPLDMIPGEALRWVVRLNPVTPFVMGYQQLLFYNTLPDGGVWLQMAVVALLSWWLGCSLFSRLQETLVEAV